MTAWKLLLDFARTAGAMSVAAAFIHFGLVSAGDALVSFLGAWLVLTVLSSVVMQLEEAE